MTSIKKSVFLSLILSIFLFSLVSAEIFIESPKSLYSFGDEMSPEIKITSASPTGDFFILSLICGESEMELYKSPITFSSSGEKILSISTTLEGFIVSKVSGDCFLHASYAGETYSTNNFKISGNIEVSFTMDKVLVEPSESVSLSGTATKSNGENLNGFAEISIKEIGFSRNVQVIDGHFSTTFGIPSSTAAKSYEVLVRSFERNGFDIITNEGTSKKNLIVKQILTSVDIAFENQGATPESEFYFIVLANDQTKNNIDMDSTATLEDSQGNIYEQSLVRTGRKTSFFIKSDYSPSYWKIRAKAGGKEVVKEFPVGELKKVSFSLTEQTLQVKNVGNIPFSGPVEIKIGSVNEIREISNLGVGETKQYRLKAPNGQYSISVNSGIESYQLGTALLTGRAISIDDVGRTLNRNVPAIILIILVLLTLLVIIYVYRMKQKNKFVGKVAGSFTLSQTPQKVPLAIIGSKTPDSKDIISEGKKQESAVISLHIKNPLEVQANSLASSAIDTALWKAKEFGARIYADGDFRVAVLVPRAPKETDISLKGITLASAIERTLKEYNKRADVKVSFGIGASSGELIVESSSSGKFKFASVDNLISSVKNLSASADREVLLSEKIRKINAGKIRSVKLSEKNLWKLEKITDRSSHEDYIRKFKEKNFR